MQIDCNTSSINIDADIIEDRIDPDQNQWLNELGIWITSQLIPAYHQYVVGLRPSL
jgi:hypothetical protein